MSRCYVSLAADFDGSKFSGFKFPVAGTLGNDYRGALPANPQ